MKLNIPIGLDEALTAAWEDPEKLPEMKQWLAEAQRSDRQQRYYAYLILVKYFRLAEVKLADDRVPNNWSRFSDFIERNLELLLQDSKNRPVLKLLLEEVVDFCFYSAGEKYAARLRDLLDPYFKTKRRFEKMPMPARALLKTEEIHAAIAKESKIDAQWDEEERIRIGMMSY